MPHLLPPPARTGSILLLICLLSLSFGCASKGSRSLQGEATSKSGGQRGPLRGTQKPYVIKGITYYPIPSAEGYVEQGIASWYGQPFHGRKTACGETYDMYGDTAAHKTLPMNTMLLVRNLENGRSTVVRVNDRGPFVQDRIIDLTYTKAENLGIVGRGTARVEIVAMAAEGREKVPEVEEPVMVASAAGTHSGKSEVKAKVAEPKTPPPPPIPDFDKGNFYVQVGAFVKLDNARLLAKAFARRGRDVIIQQYPAAGMNLYRVMIFASTSLKKAKLYEKELENEGFRHALLLAR